ncbi:Prevent host death protein, Phd antitoxin [hydrothermal vent metagenome]|uniref:Prevent host death protein, Phd antitoxin n=1 Tax=hydrothermal vent metagenome TaxID=652676 RepID=A0A3B1CPC9_9ZZZZ
MSVTVNIHEAKTHFSRLLARVSEGEEVIIAKAGRPIARLVSIVQKPKQRLPGSAKEKIVLSDDFDAPLPDEILKTFAG